MFAIRQSILLVLIGFTSLFTWTHGRSVSVIGDINIDISEDRFFCDKIECPANTDRCDVFKEKDINNSTVLVRSISCSSYNQVLKNSVTYETIDPNSEVNVHIVANRNGVISSVVNSYGSYSTSNNFDVVEFNNEMSNFMNNLQEELAELGNLFGYS